MTATRSKWKSNLNNHEEDHTASAAGHRLIERLPGGGHHSGADAGGAAGSSGAVHDYRDAHQGTHQGLEAAGRSIRRHHREGQLRSIHRRAVHEHQVHRQDRIRQAGMEFRLPCHALIRDRHGIRLLPVQLCHRGHHRGHRQGDICHPAGLHVGTAREREQGQQECEVHHEACPGGGQDHIRERILYRRGKGDQGVLRRIVHRYCRIP